MRSAATFTNPGTTAGTKIRLNLQTENSGTAAWAGLHCNPAAIMSLYAGYLLLGPSSKAEQTLVIAIGDRTGGSGTVVGPGGTLSLVPGTTSVAAAQTGSDAAFGTGNSVVSGTDGGPWTVTLAAKYATTPPPITCDLTGFTGGTDGAGSVTYSFNNPGLEPFAMTHFRKIAEHGITAYNAGIGELVVEYTIEAMLASTFAGTDATGPKFNGTNEGFCWSYSVSTSGSEAVAVSASYFIPFYNFLPGLDVKAVDAGILRAPASP